MYYSGGNVGIGTNSPTSTLEVRQNSDTAVPMRLFGGTTGAATNKTNMLAFMISDSGAGEKAAAGIQAISGNKDVNGGILTFLTSGGNYYDPAQMTEQMRILNNGYVGIGTTSPGRRLSIIGGVQPFMTATNDYIPSSAGTILVQEFGAPTGTTYSMIGSLTGGGTAWGNLILQPSGNVGIGTTTPVANLSVKGTSVLNGFIVLKGPQVTGSTYSNDGWTTAIDVRYHGGGTEYAIDYLPEGDGACAAGFWNAAGTNVGSICNYNTYTTFNTSSDRRLKENIVSTNRGLGALMSIPVNDFNFIADPQKKTVQGFVAQDLYKIYPEAVTVGGDDPKKNPWSVDYGRLTPLLVEGLQDLNNRVNPLYSGISIDPTVDTSTPFMKINNIGNIGIGTMDSNISLEINGNVMIDAGGFANHITCWKPDGKTLGYCSTAVDSSGVCACN